jgi:hypothetical protein
VLAHHTRELQAMTISTIRGQMQRRLVLIRENEMRTKIHFIRKRLGKKFLDRYPLRIDDPGKFFEGTSLPHSGRRKEISRSLPGPSESTPAA